MRKFFLQDCSCPGSVIESYIESIENAGSKEERRYIKTLILKENLKRLELKLLGESQRAKNDKKPPEAILTKFHMYKTHVQTNIIPDTGQGINFYYIDYLE